MSSAPHAGFDRAGVRGRCPACSCKYHPRRNRAASAKQNRKMEATSMAKDSRSTSNVQLIASSQGGQMKLKIPRRYRPINGIRRETNVHGALIRVGRRIVGNRLRGGPKNGGVFQLRARWKMPVRKPEDKMVGGVDNDPAIADQDFHDHVFAEPGLDPTREAAARAGRCSARDSRTRSSPCRRLPEAAEC